MRTQLSRAAAVLSAAMCILPALPQTAEPGILRVEVHGDTLDPRASAELFNMSHERIATADLRGRDYFEFRAVLAGQYWLSVIDTEGNVISQAMINTQTGSSAVSIDLPRHATSQPLSGPVSVRRLRQHPSHKAVQALMEAQRLAGRDDPAGAVEQPKKAIRLSPDYADAFTNLAAEHIRLGQYEQAIGEASQAMTIAGRDAIDLANMAFAQYMAHSFADARASAEAALGIEPASPKAHYILGVVLALDVHTAREALPHLELAAQTIPSARTNLTLLRQAVESAGMGPGR
jgi:tetratricopeptide (TPR) repeat protein